MLSQTYWFNVLQDRTLEFQAENYFLELKVYICIRPVPKMWIFYIVHLEYI